MKALLILLMCIEIVTGTCVSPGQDGREDAGYYISYKDTAAKPGDRVITVIVNDLNRECVKRFDFVKGE